MNIITPWNQPFLDKKACQPAPAGPLSILPPALPSAPSPGPAAPTPAPSALTAEDARFKLQAAGIDINKNECPVGASFQSVPGGCTSLGGVSRIAIDQVVWLKNSCQCAVSVSGGTELGHAEVGITHASGLKLDLNPNSQLDAYILKNTSYTGQRSDGAAQYRASNGTIYAKEGNHWDVTFTGT